MNFIESVKTCFKKYAVFKGRASRSEFWWFQLFTVLVEVVCVSFDRLLLGYSLEATFTPFTVISDMFLFIPWIAVASRRLHDIGVSGWFVVPTALVYLNYLDVIIPEFSETPLFGIITIFIALYTIAMIFAFVRDSEAVANKYGRNPKSEGVSEIFS